MFRVEYWEDDDLVVVVDSVLLCDLPAPVQAWGLTCDVRDECEYPHGDFVLLIERTF